MKERQEKDTPTKKAIWVSEALKTLKEQYADKFTQVFKGITADNGSEFANLSEIGECRYTLLIHTAHGKEGQTRGKMAWLDSLYRRANITIKRAEEWINKIPRKMFNYASSEERFEKEISLIYVA